MHKSMQDGIIFIEGDYKECQHIKPISVRIHGFFSQSQLKTLKDVKKEMARIAKETGGNAIINFKYGQRTTFWTMLMGIDDVSWYGDGIVANIQVT